MHRHVTSAPLRLALLGLLLAGAALVGCSSNDASGSAGATAASRATAPSTTSDPGSRYLDPTEVLGAITVETPPAPGSWTGGPTSIAKPAPRSRPSSADLPPPPVRPTPPPAPPLPNR